jgi:hypothetical protein
LALPRFYETVRFHHREFAMLRTFKIALFSAMMMAAACKKADKPATPTTEATAKAADPAKPADPVAKPGDPAAKPADPAAKPADPAPSAAAPVDKGTNSELENKAVAMMQRMADMFAADGKDCEKLATDVKGFIAQNKEQLRQLLALEKKQSEAERKAFEARNQAAQQSMMEKMGPAMEACHDNKNLEAAMKEFPSE